MKTIWKATVCIVAVLLSFSIYSCGDDDDDASGFELVQMARALVNDPAFVNKLREGDAATRSECDHRNYCIARMYSVDMKCCKHCGDLPRKIREELAKLP